MKKNITPMPSPNMNDIIGSHDVLWVVLDTLRYDVAQQEFLAGNLPTLSKYLPDTGWQKSHTPASFTYPAHHAMFAGFLPTPADKPLDPRLFVMKFKGSDSMNDNSYVFSEQATIPQGLSAVGYHTICIGGVGFFNLTPPLGNVLPLFFDEQYWTEQTGVTNPQSTNVQVDYAIQRMQSTELADKPLFTFINVSALHQPNYFYIADDYNNKIDTVDSHAAALRYVDGALAPLFDAIASGERKRPAFVIVCSDHGTTYGEDGYRGHRLAHDIVMTVPYTHFLVG